MRLLLSVFFLYVHSNRQQTYPVSTLAQINITTDFVGPQKNLNIGAQLETFTYAKPP